MFEDKFNARMMYDRAFECLRWVEEIPYLKFKEGWEVKIIPPFGGATIRFCVKANDKSVSVYLDCYDQLGIMHEPYWEIYANGEIERFLFKEHERMMARIEEILR